MTIFGMIVCKLKGRHKRGKRDNTLPVNVGEQAYRCSRCKTTWIRKVKAAK